MSLRMGESQGISLIYALTLRLHAVECAAFAAGSCTLGMWGGRDRAQYLRRSRVLCLEWCFDLYNFWVANLSSKIKEDSTA